MDMSMMAERKLLKHASSLGLATVTLLVCLNSTPASAEFMVEITRFGTCPVLATCVATFNDILTPGVINFSVTVGALPDGIFTATGTALETITRNAAGVVTGILLTLTNTTVQ